MPVFIQFHSYSSIVINADAISGLRKTSKVVQSKDIAGKTFPVVEGQTLYCIEVLIGELLQLVEYISQEHRDVCYQEILDILKPVIVGAKLPPNPIASK